MSYPNDRLYSRDHEWITTDQPARVGITQYAASALDEAVYVDLPDVDSEVSAEQACGEIESVKSVSDLVAPASGVVSAINEEAVGDPSLITSNPHETWLYEIQDASLSGELMDAESYEAFIQEL